MEILKNTYNLSRFLVSQVFRQEVLNSNQSYILCKNGHALYVIHNIEAFKRLYELADYGRRVIEAQKIRDDIDSE